METKLHTACTLRWLAAYETKQTEKEIRTRSAFECVECGVIREDITIIREGTRAWNAHHGLA